MNEQAHEVVVIGIGMTTSVGLSATETAASVRAATSRFTEIEWRDKRWEPFVVAEVPEDGLPPLVDELAGDVALTSREMRMLRLGAMPLLECLKPIELLGETVGLLLALPALETKIPIDRGAFLEKLAIQTDGVFDPRISDASFCGRAGGLLAIAEAINRIQSDTDRLLVAGGIDTYRDLYVLGLLDGAKRVQSSSNLDGFIPGEGAGFVLLAQREHADSAGLTSLAKLWPAATGFESGHLGSEEPYRGEGLAESFTAFFDANGLREPVREVYSSMNGENYWAKEWGVAYIRNQARFDPNHRMHHPADCFGDAGSACGALLTGLAALGIMGGYRSSPCLVYCSSDTGERAVTAVEKA